MMAAFQIRIPVAARMKLHEGSCSKEAPSCNHIVFPNAITIMNLE